MSFEWFLIIKKCPSAGTLGRIIPDGFGYRNGFRRCLNILHFNCSGTTSSIIDRFHGKEMCRGGSGSVRRADSGDQDGRYRMPLNVERCRYGVYDIT